MRESSSDAFLIVDVQNDFCAGGALAVQEGDAVVPVINRLARSMARRGALILASRDWHPRQTRHFAPQGGPWPVHCVAGTPGAQFHPGLELPEGTWIVTKGDEPDSHGYSAFDGHLSSGKTLSEALAERSIRRLVIAGLATDYCVRQSALDARQHGFDVLLVDDAVRGVEAEPGDIDAALREMAAAGVARASSESLLDPTRD